MNLEQKRKEGFLADRVFTLSKLSSTRCVGSSSLVAWRKQMALLGTLIDPNHDHIEPTLSASLRDLYDGDLHFPESPSGRPFVIANFVSTLDGVVSYQIKVQAGGSTISGSDPADLFIMGLLRASADAV